MKLKRSGLQQLQKALTSSSSRPCPRGVTVSTTARGRATQLRRPYATLSPDLQFGQPVHETHPHLLKAGEITRGITAEEYSHRRTKLAASLPDNGVAILAAAETKWRSGAVFYEFHQESNFFYLTGFNEPQAVAVIQKVGSSSEYIFHLFLRPKDARSELWDGFRTGEEGAVDWFNADETGSIHDLQSLLPPIIASSSEVFTDIATNSQSWSFFAKQNALTNDFQKLVKDSKVKPLQPVMNELRIVKSEAEIANMRMAGKISGRSYQNAMKRQWTTEKDLGAFFDYDFKIGGCEATAYCPVIAGGENGLCIHYVRNDNVLQDGELVLVDAGGEYGGYITDITRTWPVNGKFSDPQRDLYEAVLTVQRKCVSLCRENANMTLDQIHTFTERGLTEQFKLLGFDMSGRALDILFPHHVGHYVGLDVHDCPGYSRSVPLKAGYCVTMEPCVYVPNDTRWPEHFRGMAIRIEDSICVQDDAPLVLTTEAVKEIVDIEALRK